MTSPNRLNGYIESRLHILMLPTKCDFSDGTFAQNCVKMKT